MAATVDGIPSWSIRLARESDLEDAMALIKRAITAMRASGIDQWDDQYPDEEVIRSDIGSDSLYAATIDALLAGVIVLNEHQEPEYAKVRWSIPGRALVVHRLAIDPRCQRRGVATALMRHAEQLAAYRYETIRLDAFAANPWALAFYGKLGYSRAGSVEFRKGKFFCFEKRPAGMNAAI
jgi:ribosomal protein S18 acetylase RimI-like enzyme